MAGGYRFFADHKLSERMSPWLMLIPVISGFIGWVTNWVAIKMLFHPRKPYTPGTVCGEAWQTRERPTAFIQ